MRHTFSVTSYMWLSLQGVGCEQILFGGTYVTKLIRESVLLHVKKSSSCWVSNNVLLIFQKEVDWHVGLSKAPFLFVSFNRCNGCLGWHWAFPYGTFWSSSTCQWTWRCSGLFSYLHFSYDDANLYPYLVHECFFCHLICIAFYFNISSMWDRDGHWERNTLKGKVKRDLWKPPAFIHRWHLSFRHHRSNNLNLQWYKELDTEFK